MAATLDDLLSELKNLNVGMADLRGGMADLRADVNVLTETVVDLHANSIVLKQLPDELRLLREVSNAILNAALQLGGDHEGRLQTVEKILGIR